MTSPNLGAIIAKHNAKILKAEKNQPEKECNCRAGKPCPLGGKCLLKNIVYQAIVTETETKKVNTYIGLTSTTFKERLANHNQSFKNQNLKKSCKLAQFIWNLKDNNSNFTIEWKLIGRAAPFSVSSNLCRLCILEKYYILYKPTMATINRRSELVSNCRHKSKQLLDKG